MGWARGRVAVAAVAGVVLTAVVLGGCGVDEERTALAVESTSWRAPGRLEVTTECADDLRVLVQVDPAGTGLTQVTLGGRPRVGRCETSAVVDVPADARRIVDGTTGFMVDLPRP